MTLKKHLLGLFALVLLLSSGCVSNKKFILLQDVTSGDDSTFYYNPPKEEYRIQANDILFVNIRSQDELATILFNPSSGSTGVGPNFQNQLLNGNAFYISGYSLDDEGQIKLPMIGNLKVLGLTVKEVKALVDKEVEKYFNKFYVVVRLSGINYTMIGEIFAPGQRVIYQNQVSLLEAVANAGGFSELANRSKINLIRQYPEGYKVHQVDLTSSSVFESPYFYLQPNDMVYVEPLKIRSFGRSTTGIEAFRDVVSLFSGIAAISANVFLIMNLNNN